MPSRRDWSWRMRRSAASMCSISSGTRIWSARFCIERLLRAADRGVRVRLLLDDLGTMPSDEVLLAIDSHPNIEVRMFNPVAMRSPRLLGDLSDIGRLNKRMHNKSFTVDGQVSIVGGRNIGDEYFGANEEMNYADMDVAVIGPVVKQVSDEFDLYWNHPASIPIANLSHQNTTPEELAAKRAALVANRETAGQSEYAEEAASERVCAAAPEPEHFVFLGPSHDRERSPRQGDHVFRGDGDASRPAAARGGR